MDEQEASELVRSLNQTIWSSAIHDPNQSPSDNQS
jgi:hypothetical protein